jgi:hypothetical protein
VTGIVGLVVAALALPCSASQEGDSIQQPRGAPHQVIFTQYSPLFSNAQIMRRLLSPLAGKAVHDFLARSLAALTPYPLDLANEKFLAYVPSSRPPFALLVMSVTN